MSIAPYIRLTSLTSSAYAPSSRGPHWSERGLCTRLTGFTLADEADQLATCRHCPVLTECRDDAVRGHARRGMVAAEVVGGLTPSELSEAARAHRKEIP